MSLLKAFCSCTLAGLCGGDRDDRLRPDRSGEIFLATGLTAAMTFCNSSFSFLMSLFTEFWSSTSPERGRDGLDRREGEEAEREGEDSAGVCPCGLDGMLVFPGMPGAPAQAGGSRFRFTHLTCGEPNAGPAPGSLSGLCGRGGLGMLLPTGTEVDLVIRLNRLTCDRFLLSTRALAADSSMSLKLVTWVSALVMVMLPSSPVSQKLTLNFFFNAKMLSCVEEVGFSSEVAGGQDAALRRLCSVEVAAPSENTDDVAPILDLGLGGERATRRDKGPCGECVLLLLPAPFA